MTSTNPLDSSSSSNCLNSSTPSSLQNPVENNTSLPNSWRKGAKYYNIHIQPNLFGEICVIKSWGVVGNKRAGFKVVSCEDELEVSKVIEDIAKRRKIRGYRAPPSTTVPYPTHEILREVNLSRVEQLKSLIIPGASIDAEDDQGFTALRWAAYYGQVKIVLLLIEAGANLDSRDQYGSTALMEAVWKKHTEIARILIKYGANVNVKNRKLSTALTLAALGERDEIVSMLVKAGAVGATKAVEVVKTDEIEPTRAAAQGFIEQGVLDYMKCMEYAGLECTVSDHSRAMGLTQRHHSSTSNVNNEETTPRFFRH